MRYNNAEFIKKFYLFWPKMNIYNYFIEMGWDFASSRTRRSLSGQHGGDLLGEGPLHTLELLKVVLALIFFPVGQILSDLCWIHVMYDSSLYITVPIYRTVDDMVLIHRSCVITSTFDYSSVSCVALESGPSPPFKGAL